MFLIRKLIANCTFYILFASIHVWSHHPEAASKQMWHISLLGLFSISAAAALEKKHDQL